MRAHPGGRVAGLIPVVALVAGGLLVPSLARADVPGPITTRVGGLLAAAPAGSITGLYLKQVGGPVLAGQSEDYVFEPASSIKVVIHLYAMQQVLAGTIALTTPIPKFSGAPESCPTDTVVGSEPLQDAMQAMMQVSDNRATLELEEFFGVDALNNFAHVTLGLADTTFHTSPSPPGFNVIGCQASGVSTVDGNTSSLVNLGALYAGVADSSFMPDPVLRAEFYTLMAGKEMYNNIGYDFTGIWPKLMQMSDDEAPAGVVGSPSPSGGTELSDFEDAMTANTKGGSYGKCLNGDCSSLEEWLSFAGWAQVPFCQGNSVTSRSYVWGIFVSGGVDNAYFSGKTTATDNAFNSAAGEPLREEVQSSLAGWGACYPPRVFVSSSPAAAPPGQSGYFNAADLAAAGGGITVTVKAKDDSGVTDLLCTDNAAPAAVLGQSGDGLNSYRTGSFLRSTDGTRAIVCQATDGATPANTGVSQQLSLNTLTLKIDGTAPTVTCGPTPTFVLNGAGGNVAAAVTDATSGPAASTVSAPADVSSAGPKTASLMGHDNAGNAKTVDCPYIVSYAFLGFDSPPLKATAKAGSNVSLHFSLGDANGVPIADAEAQTLAVACGVTIDFSAGTPSPNCAAYDSAAKQFVFNLKTPKGATGAQTITMAVTVGGTPITAASAALTLN